MVTRNPNRRTAAAILPPGILAPLLILLSLLLSSCEFFYSSNFPEELALMEARADLSEYISDTDLQSRDVEMRILGNGTKKYVFLQLRSHTFSLNSRLLVLDMNLNVVADVEDDAADPNVTLGRLHMARPSGNNPAFIVGGLLMDENAGNLEFRADMSYVNNDDTGFFHAGSLNYVLFEPTSGDPSYSCYLRNSLTYAISGAPDYTGNFIDGGIPAAFLDMIHDRQQDKVAFFFRDGLTPGIHLIRISASDYSTDLITYTNLVAHPTHQFFPDVWENDVLLHPRRHRNRQEENDTFQLIGFDGQVKAELEQKNDHIDHIAFDPDNGDYVVFDDRSKIIYLARKWW